MAHIGNASNKALAITNAHVGSANGKAMPLIKGWMGNANSKAVPIWSKETGWVWQKYAVNEVTETGYREVAGNSTKKEATSAFYVGSSYTFSQTTGRFSVNHNTKIANSSAGAKAAIGKYYVDTIQTSSGTTTGDTLYLITAAKFYGFGMDLTVTPYTAEAYSTTKQEKGDLLGTVTAADITAYPLNGIADDGYWYVMSGIPEFTYSGTYVATPATMGGQNYLLLEITGSGTYASTQATSADIWICGGGGGGRKNDREGSGGGYTVQADNKNFSSIIITIGSGGSGADGGKTSISGDLTLSANGGKLPGNTGGAGGSGGAPRGRGQGTTTYLFADSSLALYCGGGGAAGYEAGDGLGNTDHYKGGAGGSNGSDGGSDIKTGINSGSTSGGAGGAGGGGVGGNYGSKKNGGDATAYGGGGGGTGNSSYYGGAGYQGVCFIRILLEQ